MGAVALLFARIGKQFYRPLLPVIVRSVIAKRQYATHSGLAAEITVTGCPLLLPVTALLFARIGKQFYRPLLPVIVRSVIAKWQYATHSGLAAEITVTGCPLLLPVTASLEFA